MIQIAKKRESTKQKNWSNVNDLLEYDNNPRVNDVVANGFREFGFKGPIISNDHVIVAGHTIFKASKK